MTTAATCLSVLAVLLGIAAGHPRLRIAYPMGWGCVAAVGVCLLADLVG